MQALRTRPVVPACRAARLHVRAMAAASSVSAPGQRYFETDKRPVVLFDGVCNCAPPPAQQCYSSPNIYTRD